VDRTRAFAEFERNLDFARELVDGGRRLQQLGIGSFDVCDLYRALFDETHNCLGGFASVGTPGPRKAPCVRRGHGVGSSPTAIRRAVQG
jgi:hypothetical protein